MTCQFNSLVMKRKSPVLRQGFFVLTNNLRGQGVAYAVEGVVDLLAQDGHDRNHDDRNEGENDRVFNETLAFFLE